MGSRQPGVVGETAGGDTPQRWREWRGRGEAGGTRAGAARICGAARMTAAVIWVGDLLDDPSSLVREAAVRALAMLGGRRAIELLVGSADRISVHRLAIALARAASWSHAG